MLQIRGIRLTIDEDRDVLRAKVAKLLKRRDFRLEIERESLDARKRGSHHELYFQYTLNVHLDNPAAERRLAAAEGVTYLENRSFSLVPGSERLPQGERPLIAGFGPAGIFAAYLLAREGYRPLVFERGAAVDERRTLVEGFWDGTLPLDPETNVQFGEGGAGTFSDGKLTSRSKDTLAKMVLEIFVNHGAPEEILYSHQPHIGTDLLSDVIVSMREQIKAWGGEVHFRTPVTSIELDRSGHLAEVVTPAGRYRGPLLLAIGHSARDSFRMLVDKGVKAEAKAFAVGFRIEHPQTLIDQLQYGEYAGHPRLGAAPYQVHSPLLPGGRNAYSFCMCPGGQVIGAASEAERLVTNGMSYHARDGELANSAILSSVLPGRDYGPELMDGLHYQEQLESAAWALGGRNMHAPVQHVQDFLQDFDLKAATPARTELRLEPSYRPGWRDAKLAGLLSPALGQTIAEGLLEIDRRLPGFAGPQAIFTGVESRSSSPLRFSRDRESRESENVAGLYPIGEGAGYAGGIVSAALDGLRTAEMLIRRYKVPEE